MSEREQRLVFGEVADEYEAFRPSYPDAVFDTIVEFGGLQAGDRALEIGAGTGKATMDFVGRGLDVHALEPTPEMGAVLRAKGVEVEEALFESWPTPAARFRLVYGAQSWHWVGGDDRYERVAAALEPGGTVAFFWNKGRDWTGALQSDNDAVYAELAPHLTGGKQQWNLDWVADGLDACAEFESAVQHTVTWSRSYTTDEWVRLIGTHSDHRILPEDQRAQLHAAVAEVIDRHGGRVEVTYDVVIFLSRKVSPRA